MKISKLQKALLKKNIDFALFLNIDENKRDKSIFYFAGVDPEFACLVVPKEKKPFLVVAKLEEELVRKDSKIKNISILGKKKLFEDLKEKIGNAKKIGVDFTRATLSEKKAILKYFKKVKLVDIHKDVMSLRIQKTGDEIEKIRRACFVTDDIFSKIVKNFRFRNESEIAEFIEEEAARHGCKLSFDLIVGSGNNSSMPHYKKNNGALKKGFCVIDFGVDCQGYKSDMTRTIYIGKPSKNEVDEYYRLLGVQEEAIRQVKAGADFKKIDESVRKVLGKTFIHGLGHGLGIDVHEPLSSNHDKIILQENSVLTVEPGIYYPNKYGIRIEDDILVTKNGREVLTKSRKELIIINKSYF